jgi:hypothetical protein
MSVHQSEFYQPLTPNLTKAQIFMESEFSMGPKSGLIGIQNPKDGGFPSMVNYANYTFGRGSKASFKKAFGSRNGLNAHEQILGGALTAWNFKRVAYQDKYLRGDKNPLYHKNSGWLSKGGAIERYNGCSSTFTADRIWFEIQHELVFRRQLEKLEKDYETSRKRIITTAIRGKLKQNIKYPHYNQYREGIDYLIRYGVNPHYNSKSNSDFKKRTVW